ncbi:FIP1 [Melia azedarach]|uniref:FIP1 n=2 Tax=Melia azedarach TaxID=155640 RepID=A0ACC1YE04_MELAZ|nr:FIP1 [Melia azedarach]KAJ4722019.1 FIP1 [Melia azedarach]
MSAKSDWEDNGYNQCNGSNAVQVASIHPTANSVVPQCTYGFLLPWTILDLNIDSFEEKLWRHPGANTSDFFNYDFNRDSWKRYCSLPAYEVGSDLGKVVREARAEDVTHVRSSPKFSDRGEKPLELPKGRAKVEGSMGEWLPSMDVKRPRIWDPDVVIEIKVHDSAEDYSGSGKEKLHLIDGNIGDHETSKNGDLEQGF